MALMECVLRRRFGTRVVLDNDEYHFKPQGDWLRSAHLCEVAPAEHAKILAAIPEAYRYADGVPAARAEPPAPQGPALSASGSEPGPEDGDRAGGRERRAALALRYREVFGQSAPSRWSAERIEQELGEQDASATSA